VRHATHSGHTLLVVVLVLVTSAATDRQIEFRLFGQTAETLDCRLDCILILRWSALHESSLVAVGRRRDYRDAA
jgi:hypothetical protein